MAGKTTIHVVPHQHFDLIWRRPFDWYRQKRFSLYQQVLELLRADELFTFTFCQTWPLRQFLEQNPQCEDAFAAGLNAGRIEIAGGVESICDLNLSSPMAIIENMRKGREWLQRRFGYTVRFAAFEDAFGVSAQLPQLVVQEGYEFYKAGRMPRPGQPDLCGNFVWQGLDGTPVRCVSPGPAACSWGWGYPDNPDEPRVPSLAERTAKVRAQLLKAHDAVEQPGAQPILFVAMGEEHDILPGIASLLRELNEESGDMVFRFSTYYDYYQSLGESFWQTCPVVSQDTDLSRFVTGCYSTRSESKRQPRQLEHRMYAALAGGESVSAICWDALFLQQFHDAAGGCHIDENAERLGAFQNIALGALRSAPARVPWQSLLPDFPDAAELRRLPGCASRGDQEYRAGGWRLHCNRGTIREICWKAHAPISMGNLSLREEHGTLWTEEYAGRGRVFPAETDRIITLVLHEHGLFVETEGYCDSFREMWPGFARLGWKRRIWLDKASPFAQVEFVAEWLGNSTEIAVRWDSAQLSVNECRAEIPFGAVRRGEYPPVMMQGDAFPCLNWVDCAHYAVFNCGTPGHALRGGALESILLRSPVKRWAPWFPVTPTEQCWDNGIRRFRFLYLPEPSLFRQADLHRAGMEFNIRQVCAPTFGTPEFLQSLPEQVVVAGLRRLEGTDWEALLFEAEGTPVSWEYENNTIGMKPLELRKVVLHER